MAESGAKWHVSRTSGLRYAQHAGESKRAAHKRHITNQPYN